MREPSFCKGCYFTRVYKHSGWECELETKYDDYCIDGSEYVSKADAQLSQYPEERKEEE